MKVKNGILVHASKIVDPGFQVVNQNKSKVMMPASFLNNQSAGTVQAGASVATIKLAGRWKGDTWSIYSRLTGTAMYGVSADMIGERSRKQVSADNVRVR